jgi:hypothetical protein
LSGDIYWYTNNGVFPWIKINQNDPLFDEKKRHPVDLTKNEPLHVKIFSGEGVELSEGEHKIYVGYQLSDGRNVFNTTPISLTYISK